MDFNVGYKDRQKKIDGCLHQYMNDLRGKIPEILSDSMEYSLYAGGKRLRPILLYEVVNALGKDTVSAMPLACALEMIHTYSLIHDDLPAMDNDDFRRGKPTNHRVFGEDIAILSGDGLLNYSFELMVNNIPEGNEKNYIQGIKEITRAAGCFGMIGGQADDIKNENSGISIELLDSINGRKTGALIKASLLAGGYFSGMSHECLSQLEKYSERIGLAFQIVDDILDIVGDQEKTGKKAGSDSINEKTTYPVKYGIEKSREIVQELYSEALVYLRKSGIRSEFLEELTSFICKRDY